MRERLRGARGPPTYLEQNIVERAGLVDHELVARLLQLEAPHHPIGARGVLRQLPLDPLRRPNIHPVPIAVYELRVWWVVAPLGR